MSAITGWFGWPDASLETLQSMARACSIPAPPHPAQIAREGPLAAAATAPSHAGEVQRVATSDDRNVTVVFAGYLFEESLDRKLRPAALCCDLYRRHGITFPVHLNGSFAAAVHDRSLDQLHLITDRLGTRALYYSEGPPFLFGSEVKAILEYPGVSRKPNADSIRRFLTAGMLAGFGSYYDHVRQVPEASVLTLTGSEVSLTRYWAPRFEWVESRMSLEDHAQRIASALRNALRRVCAGHTDIGLMLSAGLDSRAIATASEVPLACMTMQTSRGLEVRLASRIAESLGYEHEYVQLDQSYPLELVSAGSIIGDGMQAFHHAQPWVMGPLVERGELSLLLNGWGLDVVFAGWFLPNANGSGLRKLLPPALAEPTDLAPVDYVISTMNRIAPDSLLDAILLGCSYADVRHDTAQRLSLVFSERQPVGSNHDLIPLSVLCNVAKEECALNIRTVSRLTAEGIPAFDNEAIDAFLALPPDYRFNYRAYGRALELLNPAVASIPRSGTGLPITRSRRDEVLQYYRVALEFRAVARLRKLLPNSRVLDRSCWPSIPEAIRTCPAWHECLRRHLTDSYLIDTGIVDPNVLRTLVQNQIAGRASAHLLISTWLTLEEWFKRYQ